MENEDKECPKCKSPLEVKVETKTEIRSAFGRIGIMSTSFPRTYTYEVESYNCPKCGYNERK